METTQKNGLSLQNETDQSLSPEIVASIILTGDISKLNAIQKVQYYNSICTRVGVDPATVPFKYIKLSGKETLYAGREAMQQLSKLHKVSHRIVARELNKENGIYTVICNASIGERQTESIGAVFVNGLKGNDLANAIMKAETKSKRRATFDLLGLGMLDETEVETIPHEIIPTVQETKKEEPQPGPLAQQKPKEKKELSPAQKIKDDFWKKITDDFDKANITDKELKNLIIEKSFETKSMKEIEKKNIPEKNECRKRLQKLILDLTLHIAEIGINEDEQKEFVQKYVFQPEENFVPAFLQGEKI